MDNRLSTQATSINVDLINANDRHALEGLLGSSLDQGQQILILAYKPGQPPQADDKAKAKQVIESILATAHANVKEQKISDADFDSAVDEAISHARAKK